MSLTVGNSLGAGSGDAALAVPLERHAHECYLTDQLPEATASRERALGRWRALRDRRNQGDALRWLSRLAWYQGRNADAERAGREAVELLEGLAPGPGAGHGLQRPVPARHAGGINDEALTWGGRAIELADSLGQTEILIHALNLRRYPLAFRWACTAVWRRPPWHAASGWSSPPSSKVKVLGPGNLRPSPQDRPVSYPWRPAQRRRPTPLDR